MKAEERKELQRNDLAASIEKLVSGVTEGPSKNTVTYATLFAVVAALLVTGYFTYQYFSEQSKSADADRWEELNRINSANAWFVSTEDLEKFANDKKNVGTPQARMARFELARYYSQSSRDVGDPLRKKDALANVKKGRDVYAKLVDESGDAPALAQEALLGAARGSETLCEFDQAKKHYEKLAKDYPQSVYGKDAAKQLQRLKDNQDLEDLKKLFGSTGP